MSEQEEKECCEKMMKRVIGEAVHHPQQTTIYDYLDEGGEKKCSEE